MLNDFQTRLKSEPFYDDDLFFDELSQIGYETSSKKRHKYANIPAAFDIETTSFQQDGKRYGTMYLWQFGVDGYVRVGRTWEEFDIFVKLLKEFYRDDILPVYVHSLQFEFQFIRQRLKWDDVFALSERNPIRALTENIEFRCSAVLSGTNLETIGKNLQKYKCEKTHDLDYSLYRHSGTPISELELKYAVNDVKVLMCYIKEKIEDEGSIVQIPMTMTGYVRRYIRDRTIYGKREGKKPNSYSAQRYRDLMNSLTMEPDEYLLAKRCFQGGFVHASAYWSGQVIDKPSSIDFNSSYPGQIFMRKNAMSKGVEIKKALTKDSFNYYLKHYFCMFDIRFFGLESTGIVEHPLSISRCRKTENCVVDNGRVVSGDVVTTSLTNIDYEIFKKFYKWESISVKNLWVYKWGYLPLQFIKPVADLYRDKTALKGKKGETTEETEELQKKYALSKAMLNSAYGMCVMDVVRPTIGYTDDWNTEPADLNTQIEKYNKSKTRFTSYIWGVAITAWARYSLFMGISEFGNDYIYSDTDSIKCINYDRHIDFINRYNNHVKNELLSISKMYKLPDDFFLPKTVAGIEKVPGAWDYEGEYSRAKFLRAKAYMVEDVDGIHLTCAGLGKKSGGDYISEQVNPFDFFAHGMTVPADRTGKLTHLYQDEPIDTLLTDYTGQTAEIHELASVNLTPAPFHMQLTDEYIAFLLKMAIDSRRF